MDRSGVCASAPGHSAAYLGLEGRVERLVCQRQAADVGNGVFQLALQIAHVFTGGVKLGSTGVRSARRLREGGIVEQVNCAG